MRKMINREQVSGRIYEHSLVLKESGPTSKNPGTPYLSGTLSVATDDAGLNIVDVHYTYVTATTKSGATNNTFTALKNIIDNGKTVLIDGAENATLVKCDTSLDVNDFYTNRNGEEQLVSAKRNEGGFVTIVNKLAEENTRNHFECDVLINGTRVVEADEERHIPADYLVVKGAVFNFRNAILPVEFVVKNPGGIKYFESLDASPSNMVLTKVWGNIESQTIVDKREEESAFGEASVKEYERKVREWVITGTAKEAYDLGDEAVLTTEEIKQMLADRETKLAEDKRRSDEWRASQAAAPTTGNVASAPAAQGGFNF